MTVFGLENYCCGDSTDEGVVWKGTELRSSPLVALITLGLSGSSLFLTSREKISYELI